MPYRSTPFAIGEFYHIYNRGNSKQKIFRDDADFQRFQQLLFLANTAEAISFRNAAKRKDGLYSFERDKPLVAIGAYCLLPNHFHLLVTPLQEEGISQFMQRLATSYVMYFNKKYERVGSLFEGQFRSKHADNDRYLKYLFSYIHLNAAQKVPRPGLGTNAGSLNQVVDYFYCSLMDYMGAERNEGLIISPENFPNYFSANHEVQDELLGWLKMGNDYAEKFIS